MDMNIAIIGSGNVGKALAGSFARADHHVTLAARDVNKVNETATELGVSAAATLTDAARDADVIILAVPFDAVAEVATELRPVVHGKVVIDATNPLKTDYSGLATEGGRSGAERLAEMLPEAKVVKAFNTMFGSIQADPRTHGTTLDAFFATDDDHAREILTQLISSLGLRPIDAGPLNAARELEALAWLNIRIQMQSNGDWRSAFVLVGAPREAIAA